MKLNLWLYIVYRVQEEHFDNGDYDTGSGTTVEIRTPIAGYQKKEDAEEHAEAASSDRSLHGTHNRWDPFLPIHHENLKNYVAGALPLLVPSSVVKAPEEMQNSIGVLRDFALETQDKKLARELPPMPVTYPLWSISGQSTSRISHYFDGKSKKGTPWVNVSCCGVYLSPRVLDVLETASEKRRCLICLKLLSKGKS